MSHRRIIFTPTQQRTELLDRVKDVTGLTYTEILRRFIDHCARENRLNQMFPTVSGSFSPKGVG